jgi:protein-L-isoaspartate(D-aspartate) O-methyltransferase
MSLRETYARSLGASPRLERAFAAVARERFLPSPPWLIAQPFDRDQPYRSTEDLADVYSDAVLAIDPERQLNNGQPSAHARWLDAVLPEPSDAVLHVGCGTGYYTAVLAELCTRVDAFEIDATLAQRAREALEPWPKVRVHAADASGPPGRYGVIYVNAGATHARREWLDALEPSGRLLLPLTAHLLESPSHAFRPDPPHPAGERGALARARRVASGDLRLCGCAQRRGRGPGAPVARRARPGGPGTARAAPARRALPSPRRGVLRQPAGELNAASVVSKSAQGP